MIKSFVQRFIFDKLPIRGAYVELTDLWQKIMAQKEYPDGVKQILGELLVANILLTTNIKLDGKVIAQIQDNPKLDLVISECDNELHARATAKFATSIHSDNQISYLDCVAHGRLVISVDSDNKGKLYQSVIALSGHDLSQVLNEYMTQSEQLRSIFILVYAGTKIIGFMLQQIPDQRGLYLEDIDRIFRLAQTLNKSELIADNIENLLQQIFNEDDIMLFDPQTIKFSCTCSRDRVSAMLRSLGRVEAESIIATEGKIKINCEFCNTLYEYDIHDVFNIFSTLYADMESISQEIH